MKKNLKKVFSSILVIAMTASMMTACGSSGSKSTDTSSDSASDTAAEGTSSTGSEEPTEISVMIWDRGSAAPGTSNEENTLTEWIQEQVLADCNVKVNYVAVPRSGSDDKVNVMMAGGNAPDVVFTYSANLFGEYTSKEGVADLTASLAAYGENITKYIGDIQYMGQYENKQYAIMKRRGFQIPRHITYIRQDWLDALGMEMPKTKEDLIKYFYSVKEKNPGNVTNVIPWGMGGTTDTEKFYLHFVESYVPSSLSERDAYIYSENFIAFADGAINGIKELNKLYNDGLISPDFAVDTTMEVYKTDVSSGRVGFMLDDSTNYFDYAATLKATIPEAEFVPLNCLELEDGSYRNPTEPLYGMYIMVPATSQEKTDAVVKYLNWLTDPKNAENVCYTPEHTTDEAGVPISLPDNERTEKGYPENMADYNIVNDHFTYVDSKEGMVSFWSTGVWSDWLTPEWASNLYDVCTTNQFLYPTAPVVLESETTYKSNLESASIGYVYNLMTCSPDEFDAVQQSEYQKLVDAGLEKIFEERAAYYDNNMAK
jgi:putative aldouronate transport system substrate-binding protein